MLKGAPDDLGDTVHSWSQCCNEGLTVYVGKRHKPQGYYKLIKLSRIQNEWIWEVVLGLSAVTEKS